MKAAIDIGSNTVRMLVGDSRNNEVVPHHYFRCVTRLAGGYDANLGISLESGERTLVALKSFAQRLREINVTNVRAVATEAVRRALNAQQFVANVLSRTGFNIEIIDGDVEAAFCCRGVIAALDPQPESVLIFDIGGGSTEFIICKAGKRLWQKSYPLGVITLAESSAPEKLINHTLSSLRDDLGLANFSPSFSLQNCELVGTAGTITTLAALDLKMTEYDWQRVNNHVLSQAALQEIYGRLLPLTPVEREKLPGIEKGRGDLIITGSQIVLSLLRLFSKDQIKVCDFGLLEGVLLSME